MPHVRSRDQATANWQLAALNYFTSPALKEATEGQNSEWLSGISTGLVLKIFREISKKKKKDELSIRCTTVYSALKAKEPRQNCFWGGGGNPGEHSMLMV